MKMVFDHKGEKQVTLRKCEEESFHDRILLEIEEKIKDLNQRNKKCVECPKGLQEKESGSESILEIL
jgi:hypothetical protein